jgi:hypothetical protein
MSGKGNDFFILKMPKKYYSCLVKLSKNKTYENHKFQYCRRKNKNINILRALIWAYERR